MSNQDILKGVLKYINNPYASIADDGIVGDINGYASSGIYMLNALISGDIHGGIPYGKVVAFAGQKGTGKSYLLLECFKTFLKDNPEGNLILFESEGAMTKDLLIERGIDPSKISIIPVSTVEEFHNQIMNVLDYIDDNYDPDSEEYPKFFIGLDSLGMLSTEHEIKGASTGDIKSDMGRKSKLLKGVFRTITLKLARLQIPMIITNHTYSSMSQYAGDVMSGGSGLDYAASIIVFLSKSKVKDNKSKIKNLTGNNITCRLEKGRLTKEGSKVILDLDFDRGINKWTGVLPILIESEVLKKKGAWISYNGENIAQGDAKFYTSIDDIMVDDFIEEIKDSIGNVFRYGNVKNGE